MAEPTVCVIVPTYNHAPLLKKALESLIAQTFTDWEVVVINNFSGDDTIQIVESFNDSRIRITNFRNSGVIAASRNEGLRLAKGKYIAFLDSDDLWYPNKLQKCVDQARLGFSFIGHGELWVNDELTQRPVLYGPTSRATYRSLLYRGNCISTSATFIEKSLIDTVGGFDENPEIISTEDYDLWMRLAALAPATFFIREVLGEFHRRPGSASSSVTLNLASELVVLKKHFARQSKTFWNRARMRHRYAIAYYGAARQLVGMPKQAMQLFSKAWVLSPLVLRIYPGVFIALVRCRSVK